MNGGGKDHIFMQIHIFHDWFGCDAVYICNVVIEMWFMY